MKNYIKVIFVFLFSLLILFLSKNAVQANSISKISMDIYVDNSGNASITEMWNCYTNSGTEAYHPYYNLGKSEIKDLTVSENGKTYTTLSSWNTSGSLSSKAYQCGINKISNGVELCWGISEYGSHTYTVKYTITNFIAQLNDSQMLYWTFIPYDFSTTIGSASIKVYADFDIPDTVGVWGYGNYGGLAYVDDGCIEMESDGKLDTSEYMTMLVQFPNNSFNTSNTINHNFDYYLDMAEEGSTKYQGESINMSVVYFIIGVTFIVFYFAYRLFLFFGMNFIDTAILKVESGLFNFRFGKAGKKIPSDVPYYRDIPCKKDILRAYFIGYKYGIFRNKTNILGAIILKWIKDSMIRIEQKENIGIFKKDNTVIILNETDPDKLESEHERSIFKMLNEASKDGILENKEFEKWCRKSYSRILEWFEDIIKAEQTKLVAEGLILQEEKITLKIFKCNTYTATPELKQEAIDLAGLKKYLKDYTLIKDREAIEVTMFEEYLIYAQMMGIAKEVSKEFKDLYPEVIEQSKFDSYDNIIFISACVAHGVSSAQSARVAANSYSSGGGGGGSFGRRWRWRGLPLKQRIAI